MLKCTWTKTLITTNKQANDMLQLAQSLPLKYGAFDTETTGLHITVDKPFLFQFGFLHPDGLTGHAYIVDIERQPLLAHMVIVAWNKIAKTLQKYFGHNVKFDTHMMTNLGHPYYEPNLSDTMFYIRYAHDAVQEKYGGPPLKLKEYTARYIHAPAREHDQSIQHERGAMAKDMNAKLKLRLKACTVPPQYNAKAYTLGLLETMFKDALFTIADLPQDAQDAYAIWLNEDVPDQVRWQVTGIVDKDMIPYTMVNREHLYKYAFMDIVYPLELFLLTEPVLKYRHNEPAVALEERCIMPFWEMERVGFNVDKQYLLDSRDRVRDYIRTQRAKLFDIAGEPFTIGQHLVVKRILQDVFGITLVSTDASVLETSIEELMSTAGNEAPVEFITILQELRTLEKWYSTYILRFINNLKLSDRLYTTIHQVGTVSGRVTSDFQQFPKGAITTQDGTELFHPRKLIKPTGGKYNATVFLDYSQIELRVMGAYTILVGDPDINLCRAYMPYRCVKETGEIFDYNNPEHLADWAGAWFQIEDGKPWVPTDIHGATTTTATGLQPGEEGFKENRSAIGKRVNFASQYGATITRFRIMFPHLDEEQVQVISAAYGLTFPGVKSYHQYCYRRADEYPYTTNLYGVNYYGVSGHKLINLLIQGSSAYLLKDKICQLYEYSKLNKIQSKFQMNIHDELSWEQYQGEILVFFCFKQIMESWPGLPIPIVAEMEVTKTNWAEKKGVHDVSELYTYLGN